MSKVRAQWLFAFFCFIAIFLSVELILANLGSEEEMYFVFADMFRMMIVGWLVFHFAYRKLGTRMLWFIVIMLPIGMIGGIYKEMSTIEFNGYLLNAIYFITLVISQGAVAWFWLHCLRYLRENRMLKKIAVVKLYPVV